MQNILKTFRLPASHVQFIEDCAERNNISQTEVIIESLQQMMESQGQWEDDLSALAKDQEYRKEQIKLAEEHYE